MSERFTVRGEYSTLCLYCARSRTFLYTISCLLLGICEAAVHVTRIAHGVRLLTVFALTVRSPMDSLLTFSATAALSCIFNELKGTTILPSRHGLSRHPSSPLENPPPGSLSCTPFELLPPQPLWLYHRQMGLTGDKHRQPTHRPSVHVGFQRKYQRPYYRRIRARSTSSFVGNVSHGPPRSQQYLLGQLEVGLCTMRERWSTLGMPFKIMMSTCLHLTHGTSLFTVTTSSRFNHTRRLTSS